MIFRSLLFLLLLSPPWPLLPSSHLQIQGPSKRFLLGCVIPTGPGGESRKLGKTFLAGPVEPAPLETEWNERGRDGGGESAIDLLGQGFQTRHLSIYLSLSHAKGGHRHLNHKIIGE